MRQFISPFVLKTAGVTKAWLEHCGCGATGSIPLQVANGTGAASGVATLSTDAALPKGVLTLRVVAACGCFHLPVFSHCPPPTTESEYDGGSNPGGVPVPVPSC
jgi:hypothetical protein